MDYVGRGGLWLARRTSDLEVGGSSSVAELTCNPMAKGSSLLSDQLMDLFTVIPSSNSSVTLPRPQIGEVSS